MQIVSRLFYHTFLLRAHASKRADGVGRTGRPTGSFSFPALRVGTSGWRSAPDCRAHQPSPVERPPESSVINSPLGQSRVMRKVCLSSEK